MCDPFPKKQRAHTQMRPYLGPIGPGIDETKNTATA